MKIRHFLSIFLAVLGILALLALAAFMTVYVRDDSDPLRQKLMQIVQPVLHVVEQPATEAPSTEAAPVQTDTAAVKEHSFLFVGDSRTLGMRDAVGDNCTYLGAEGQGYQWFASEGLSALDAELKAQPNRQVIINFGVNDPENVNLYIDLYHTLIETYPDASFYLLSVNPLVDSEDLNTTNEMIALFNATIAGHFPDQYLDSNSFLTSTGFETVDGLHYTDATYQAIHNFVVDKLCS